MKLFSGVSFVVTHSSNSWGFHAKEILSRKIKQKNPLKDKRYSGLITNLHYR